MTRTHYQEHLNMKNRHTTIAGIFATLLMAFAVAVPAQADWTRMEDTTHMTFKHAVRLPGVTLPAGRYVFQLNDSRDFVRIFSEDNSKVFGPYLVNTRRRIPSTTKRVVMFDRSLEAGGVPTIRAWWSGYREQGHEFVYLNGRS